MADKVMHLITFQVLIDELLEQTVVVQAILSRDRLIQLELNVLDLLLKVDILQLGLLAKCIELISVLLCGLSPLLCLLLMHFFALFLHGFAF